MSDKYPGGFVTTGAPAGFSVAFNGSSDYLTIATGVAFGSGAYTIECWFNANAYGSFYTIIGNGGTNSLVLSVDSSTAVKIDQTNVGSTTFTVPTMALNAWHHLVVVRNSSNATTVFVDGVRSSTGAVTLSNNFSVTTKAIGYTAGGGYWNGYISNLRCVVGTAVYDPTQTTINVPTQLLLIPNTQLLTCNSPTIVDQSSNAYALTPTGTPKVSNFTPFAGYQGFNPALGAAAGGVWTLDEAAYYQNNRQWPIYDPYFNRTTLMLHGNGANTAQNNTFLDSSTNNFTITRNGNTTQGTFTPFSQTGWSTYFNGSGSLGAGSNSQFVFGTGDYTIEFWVNLSSYNGTYTSLFTTRTAGDAGGNGCDIQILNSSGTYILSMGNPVGAIISANNVTSLNTWMHIAGTRANGIMYLFVNGVQVASGASSYNFTVGSPFWGAGAGGASNYTTGYISNLRVIKGTGIYSSNFTPSTQPLTAITNTVLLSSQSNRFVDNGANNFALTVNGSGTTIQAFSPFVPTVTTPTTYSNWFDGSGDYLTVPSNAAFNLGSSTNWTIEGFYYPTSYTASNGIITNVYVSTGDKVTIVTIGTNGYLQYFINGSVAITSTTAGTLNAWNYFAVVRNGATTTLYLNGVSLGTTATTPTNSSKAVSIGFDTTVGSAYFYGCISNVRITTGASLTVTTTPTAPLTTSVPAGTVQLLTCQNNTFKDNSTNSFTLTAFGNVQPVASPTPFAPLVDQTTLNTAYSTSLIGGSAYFDGTGDYLTLPSSTAFALDTGDFTFETWFYPTVAATGANQIFECRSSNVGFCVLYNTGNVLTTLVGAPGVWSVNSSTTAIPLNSWVHYALTRSGTTFRIFLNGTLIFTSGSIAGSMGTNARPAYIGNASSLTEIIVASYVSGMRLVKGTALYTSSFTPPTTPPTNITNTVLLCNFTNAGIIDNTAKNVLETVSSAAISTTQAKWGTSSMNFPVTTSAYLKGAVSQNTKFPGAFTIEAWIYPTQVAARADIFATPTAASSGTGIYWYVSSTAKLTLDKGGGNLATSTLSISVNTWTHVAATRNSAGAITLWINGVASGTGSDTTNFSDGNLFVGTEYALANFWNGFIADLRVTQGIARYTANFTPPTSQLQDQ